MGLSSSGAFSCQEYWECQAKVPRCYWSYALWASAQVGSGAAGSSQSGQQEVVAVLQWQETVRDVQSEDFRDWEVEQIADALELRSLRAVPGVWRLPVRGQADDINSECFSLLGSWSIRTRIPQITHTQLYATTCGVLDSIHQVGAPPPQWAELEVPLGAMVMSSLRTIVGPTRRGAWIGKNYSCISRRNCCKRSIPELTPLLTKSILGLQGWLRAGYRGVGDIRPACLFPSVKSKCFLDSGVRRCWKVGHSCMRRVIDCSSVPHKISRRSVPGAIRTVARLGGPVCEIFDISQLRFELDSMFQELDTPPSRCYWRCGCAPCLALV